LPAIAPLQLQRLAQAPRFTLTETSRIGPDLLHIWHRSNTPT
jgi:diaminohydroxyphosphoribosylaminopyrimidine deaminase/5-amino-6-(5-phosphoribosylamino)uracil reductase